MLIFSLPSESRVAFMSGNSETVRVNGVPTVLTMEGETIRFTNEDGPQARQLLGFSDGRGLATFHCTGEDGEGLARG